MFAKFQPFCLNLTVIPQMPDIYDCYTVLTLGLSVDYEICLPNWLASTFFDWLVPGAGLNIGWNCLSHNGLWAHVTGGNFHHFSEATHD